MTNCNLNHAYVMRLIGACNVQLFSSKMYTYGYHGSGYDRGSLKNSRSGETVMVTYYLSVRYGSRATGFKFGFTALTC